jgi:tetratricopeptide (TPR) repeat protein
VRAEALIKEYPDSWELHAIRSQAYLNRGIPFKAYEDAIRVIRIDAKQVEGWRLKGEALRALGRTDSAIVTLQQAIRINATPKLYYELGRSFNQAGQAADAIVAFESCFGLDPEYYRAYRESGTAYSAVGDTGMARIQFDRAIELAPKDPVNWNSRGLHFWAKNGMHEQAIADYNVALKLNVNYAFAFNNRGFSKWKTGDKQGALKDIRKSNQRRPNNPFVYRNLGLIKLSDGRVEEACGDFRKAQELDFEALYGNEVSELIKANCKQGKPVPNKPTNGEPAPDERTPRSNAPGG